MDDLTFHALEQMLGSALTNHPLDNKRAVIALRMFRNSNEYPFVLDMVKRKRAIGRCWIFETQRKWQMHRRTVTPLSCEIRRRKWGRKHNLDTILSAEYEATAMREGYVRCDGKKHSTHKVDFLTVS